MVGDAGGSSSRRDFDQIMSATVDYRGKNKQIGEDTRDPAINNGQTNSKVIMAK
jgi:hypothetical protein